MKKHLIIKLLKFLWWYFLDETTYTVTIVSSPAGTPVSGSFNTFEYPILSNVNLTCDVTSDDGSPFAVTSYRWNTEGCHTNPYYNNGNPSCFPYGKTTQSVTENEVTIHDAGTINCTATIRGSDYTSESFTLELSGEHLWLAYIMYYSLLHICCHCFIHHLLHFIYNSRLRTYYMVAKDCIHSNAYSSMVV